jgi:Lrp/AsnC family transcriptional regulator
MIDKNVKLDDIDLKILTCLQRNSALSQRGLAEEVGLSQNACWRRLQRLQGTGVMGGLRAEIDLELLGLDLTVIVMIRTRHHSKEWSEDFRKHVDRLPEVIDFYRIGGDWDYLIKVVTHGISGYDAFYQKLITNFDLATVTGYFAMEAIIRNRAVDLNRLR